MYAADVTEVIYSVISSVYVFLINVCVFYCFLSSWVVLLPQYAT